MLIRVDTPDSIDPFTYTSSEPSQAYKTTMSTISMGPSTIPCLVATQATTFVPPAPSAAAVPSVAPATAADGSTVKPRPSGPKIGFPTTHLSELYSLIHGNTKIKPDLVSQLRQQFENITSKAAIEAKVKEVAFREGKTKDSQWKVKPEAWVGRSSDSNGHNSSYRLPLVYLLLLKPLLRLHNHSFPNLHSPRKPSLPPSAIKFMTTAIHIIHYCTLYLLQSLDYRSFWVSTSSYYIPSRRAWDPSCIIIFRSSRRKKIQIARLSACSGRVDGARKTAVRLWQGDFASSSVACFASQGRSSECRYRCLAEPSIPVRHPA